MMTAMLRLNPLEGLVDSPIGRLLSRENQFRQEPRTHRFRDLVDELVMEFDHVCQENTNLAARLAEHSIPLPMQPQSPSYSPAQVAVHSEDGSEQPGSPGLPRQSAFSGFSVYGDTRNVGLMISLNMQKHCGACSNIWMTSEKTDEEDMLFQASTLLMRSSTKSPTIAEAASDSSSRSQSEARRMARQSRFSTMQRATTKKSEIPEIGALRSSAMDHLQSTGAMGPGKSKKGDIWPTLVRLRDIYTEEAKPPSAVSVAIGSHRSFFRLSYRAKYTAPETKKGSGPTFRKWFMQDNCVFHPDSTFMMIVDLLGVIMVIVEVFVTPLVLAWDMEVRGNLLFLVQLLCAFWIWDFIVCLNTGFYDGGLVVMNRSTIFFRYLKGWMLPDLALIFVDVAALALQREGVDGGTLQTLRFCRVLKVLRISRLVRFVSKAMAWSLLLSVRFAVQIIPIVLMSLLALHILTCIWYVIGTKMPSDTGHHWVEVFADELTITWTYEYMTALHWTVSQITLGSTDVASVNTFERFFNILILLVALLSGSTLISVISAQMSQIVVLKQDNMIKLSILRRYLLQERVPHKLSAKVQRQAMLRLEHQGAVAEERVHSMKTLSTTLQLELRYATRVPKLIEHALFRSWAGIDMTAVEELCVNAVTFKNLVEEDDLFLLGEPANFCYLLVEGMMNYSQATSPNADLEGAVQVERGLWIAEPALWCQWTHVGKLTALHRCKVMAIDSMALEATVRSCETVAFVTLTYAKNYYQRVTQAMPPTSEFPTDLRVPFTDEADLLSRDVDLSMLRLALQHGTVELGADEVDMLEAELRQGRCSLQTLNDGQVLRSVSLVALKVKSKSGEFLVEVGKWTTARGAKPSCQLPGTKRNRGELPPHAVQRLLDKDLRVFQDIVSLEAVDHAREQMPSPKYGIDTTYLKAIFVASLVSEPMWESVYVDPGKLRWSLEEEAQLQGIFPRDIFVLPDAKNEFMLYAWVDESQFERLRSDECRKALASYMRAIDIDPQQAARVASDPTVSFELTTKVLDNMVTMRV